MGMKYLWCLLSHSIIMDVNVQVTKAPTYLDNILTRPGLVW